jgi:hypothetical protein
MGGYRVVWQIHRSLGLHLKNSGRRPLFDGEFAYVASELKGSKQLAGNSATEVEGFLVKAIV